MTNILLLVLAGFAVILLGVIGVILWRFRPGSSPSSGVEELTGRIAQLAEETRRAQQDIAQTLNTRLDAVSERMGKSLETSATKTAESLGQIQTRLKVIDEAQKNIETLSGEIVSLQDILSNKQSRGAFGEVQLRDLVTNTLPPNAYGFQETLSNGTRADCLIRLPNPPGSIVIDAKFPLEAFRQLQESKDDQQKALAARQFGADIMKHVKDIAGKYILNGETADSALLFLPSEAVYAELHTRFPDIVEKSYRARVWIVSPTTMMALLNTVRAVLKDVHMREQAGIIQQHVAKLMDDVGRMDKRVEALGRHFDQAQRDLKDIEISSRKISRHVEDIEKIEMDETGAEALEQDTPKLRPIE